MTNEFITNYLSKTRSDAYILTDNKIPIRDWIDSGNILLNALLSANYERGYPSGRITQLVGPNSSGKTYLAKYAMLNAQKKGYVVHLIDSEFGQDTESWIEDGINPDLFIHNPLQHIKTITSELLLFLDQLTTKDKAIIIIDSVGNLSSNKETDDLKEFIDKRDMTRAQELKAMFRQLVMPSGQKNVPIIIANHEYDSPDMFSGKIQGGGSGPAYSSSIIISMTKSKEKKGNEIIGSGLTCTNHKNRFSKEKERIKIVINYNERLDRYSGLFDAAYDMGFIVSPVTGWYTLNGSDNKFRKKEVETDSEFWDKQLKTGFGIMLNNRFKYQSNAIDLVNDTEDEEPIEEVKKTKTKTKKTKT